MLLDRSHKEPEIVRMLIGGPAVVLVVPPLVVVVPVLVVASFVRFVGSAIDRNIFSPRIVSGTNFP
jgi:hypothetical protein